MQARDILSPSGEPSIDLTHHSRFRVSIASCIEMDPNCLSQNSYPHFTCKHELQRIKVKVNLGFCYS